MCHYHLIFSPKTLSSYFTLLFWQALIQCEQLKNELQRQTDRLEKELASQQEKRALEKEMMKKEIMKERQDRESEVTTATLGYPVCRKNAVVLSFT